jgi:hypothetical protein
MFNGPKASPKKKTPKKARRRGRERAPETMERIETPLEDDTREDLGAVQADIGPDERGGIDSRFD